MTEKPTDEQLLDAMEQIVKHMCFAADLRSPDGFKPLRDRVSFDGPGLIHEVVRTPVITRIAPEECL